MRSSERVMTIGTFIISFPQLAHSGGGAPDSNDSDSYRLRGAFSFFLVGGSRARCCRAATVNGDCDTGLGDHLYASRAKAWMTRKLAISRRVVRYYMSS